MDLADRLNELCAAIRDHHEVSAHFSPEGIVVEVRGTITARRLYSIAVIDLARVNVLTLELDAMRAEAGSFHSPFTPQDRREMGEVIPLNLPLGADREATVRTLQWLRKKLEEGQPEHRERLIKARIFILEARLDIHPPPKP